MKKILLLLMFLLLPLSAKAIEYQELLDGVQKNYTNVESFEASFKQVLFHRESGTNQERTGKFLFKAPQKIYWETERPHAEVLVTNGQVLWNYLPDEDLAYQYNMDMLEASHLALKILTGQENLSDNFEISVLGSGEETMHLRMYPYEVDAQMVEAELWIDKKKEAIQKLKVVDFFGNSNFIEILSFEKNAEVEDSLFDFVVPDGVDVEDHREVK